MSNLSGCNTDAQKCERCKDRVAQYHLWKRDTGARRLCSECITPNELAYINALTVNSDGGMEG